MLNVPEYRWVALTSSFSAAACWASLLIPVGTPFSVIQIGVRAPTPAIGMKQSRSTPAACASSAV